jgi:predicted NACHT family NTPase
VITSRDRAYREGAVLKVPHRCVSLAPLEDKDIIVFLQKWYGSLEDAIGGEPMRALRLAESLKNLLSSPDRKDLRSLAGTPLLLLIMALIHRIGKGLPDRRVDLYDAFIKILLEEWNKETDRPAIPANPARAVLRPLAFWLHNQAERYSATIGELEPVIRSDLERTPQLKYDNPSEFLKAVRDLSGLLVGESQDDYAFLHPTFQEFLAAEHVKTEPSEAPRLKQRRRR